MLDIYALKQLETNYLKPEWWIPPDKSKYLVNIIVIPPQKREYSLEVPHWGTSNEYLHVFVEITTSFF